MGARDIFVEMHRAEEPSSESARLRQLLKICVEPRHARRLAVLEHQEAFDFKGRLMGDNVIHSAVRSFDIFGSLKKLLTARDLKFRPCIFFKTDIDIGAFAAAHSEEGHVVDLEDLTPHQMKKIRADFMNLSAVPFGNGIRIEKLEIFVRSVDEADIEFLLAELFEISLLMLAVVPHKTEIAANDQRVALFQLFESRRIESLHIAVHISCYIYHISIPLFCYSKYTP